MHWEIIGKDVLVAPLTTIKGLGEKAIEQILTNRPFNTVEELLFNDGIVYSKLNKKALDVLCRSGALSSLIDDRFSGDKHFWSAVCVDRPRKPKNLIDNIETYQPEGSFTEEEKLTFTTDLTGIFPISKVITDDVQSRIDDYVAPPISEYDRDLGYCWCIPRKITLKKSRNGKNFYVVEVVDSNSVTTKIRCWSVKPDRDEIHINRPYMLKPKWNLDWGFSTYGATNNSWFLLG